jgi:signal transduction histidine kinase
LVLAGLALHRRRLGVLTRIQRLEHANEMEKERTRIAQDMHDDLGASLTQVAILSEVAKKALHSPEKVEQHVDRISTTARSMVDTITEIIWAIGPRNDRMDSLCAFLREHATNRLEDAQLAFELNFPEEVGPLPVTAEFRRNLLLVLKESLNNLLKHAGATRVVITLRLVCDGGSDWLELLVSDNGRGFDPSRKTQFHSGLANMRERIVSLGGELRIETRQGAGTDIRARVPLSARCPPPDVRRLARSRFFDMGASRKDL